MTSTPRVAKTRQRQREAGLVRVEVLVPKDYTERIRKHAKEIIRADKMLRPHLYREGWIRGEQQ